MIYDCELRQSAQRWGARRSTGVRCSKLRPARQLSCAALSHLSVASTCSVQTSRWSAVPRRASLAAEECECDGGGTSSYPRLTRHPGRVRGSPESRRPRQLPLCGYCGCFFCRYGGPQGVRSLSVWLEFNEFTRARLPGGRAARCSSPSCPRALPLGSRRLLHEFNKFARAHLPGGCAARCSGCTCPRVSPFGRGPLRGDGGLVVVVPRGLRQQCRLGLRCSRSNVFTRQCYYGLCN